MNYNKLALVKQLLYINMPLTSTTLEYEDFGLPRHLYAVHIAEVLFYFAFIYRFAIAPIDEAIFPV